MVSGINSSGLGYDRRVDWLGGASSASWTPPRDARLTSTPSRTVSGEVAYAPFSEIYAATGSPAASFTGQNQDTDPNLYDFMYREYGIQGRWPSPDPLGPGAFNLSNPQSLNRYAYVLNNPTNLVDALGLLCESSGTYEDITDEVCIAGGGTIVGLATTVTVNGSTDSTTISNTQWIPWPYSGTSTPWTTGDQLVGGGGGGQTRAGGQPQTQTPQQCMSSFNNSTIGKAASFFSLLDLPSTIWDWLALGGAKAVGVEVLKAETSATVTNYSITAGTATTATTGLETVVAVGSKALGVTGSIAVVAGTAVDAQQRLVCHGLINPNDAAALGSPIMPIFP